MSRVMSTPACLMAQLLLCLSFLSCRAFADFSPFHKSSDYETGLYGNFTRQTYITEPHLSGPVANILEQAETGLSPSKHFFFAPGGPHVPRARPMVLDAKDFSLVWSGPGYDSETMTPELHQCNDTSYLTFYSGRIIDERKAGRHYFYNSNYDLVYNISSVGDLPHADAHELQLTPQCTAIITSYETRSYNLSQYSIENGWLMDSYFQEIDLATGQLLFQWQASAHINMSDSLWVPSVNGQGKSKFDGYDYFHINSVEKDARGNYLISARHMNSIYYISGVDGTVIWTLGGLGNDFKDLSDGKAIDFAWQHDARWVDANMTEISLYDDRNTAYHHAAGSSVSRGIIIAVDTEARTATLEHEYLATHDIHSVREGSMQVLSDSPEPGNALVGYGNDPAWTEFAPDGTVLLDVHFGPLGLDRYDPDNYRARKRNWTATPTHWAPRIAAGPRPEYAFDNGSSTFHIVLNEEDGAARTKDHVYMSWNGATEISHWVVIASNTTAVMSVAKDYLTRIDKAGFESNFQVGSETRFVRALAVNADGAVLGVTSALDLINGDVIEVQFELQAATAELSVMQTAVAALEEIQQQQQHDSTWSAVKETIYNAYEQTLYSGSTAHVAIVAVVAIIILTLCCVPVVLLCRRKRRQGYSQQFALTGDDGDEFRISFESTSAVNDDEESGFIRFKEFCEKSTEVFEDDCEDSRRSSNAETLCEDTDGAMK